MESGNKENIEAPGIIPRLKELFFDWLFICAYLVLLLLTTLAIYLLIFNDVPAFTNYQSQLIATMSTINGIYNGFDTPFSIIFSALSMALAVVYILMAFISKDKRHLADILSGSTVVKNRE